MVGWMNNGQSVGQLDGLMDRSKIFKKHGNNNFYDKNC